MEEKVSAKELMDIVMDTNSKVSEMAQVQANQAKEMQEAQEPQVVKESQVAQSQQETQEYSDVGTFISMLFIIFGVALSVAAVFQQVAGVDVTFFFSSTVWNIIYAGFATMAVISMSLSNIDSVFRLMATFLAFLPMYISFIMPIV